MSYLVLQHVLQVLIKHLNRLRNLYFEYQVQDLDLEVHLEFCHYYDCHRVEVTNFQVVH